MGHDRKKLWLALALAVAVLLVVSCASGATPTATPAAKAPGEKAAPATTAAKPSSATAEAKPAAAATKPAAEAAKEPLPKMINLATHSPGTMFNAAGTALAKVASDSSPIRTVVQPFSGPPAWVPGMNGEGKPEVGLINAVEGRQAYTGKVAPNPLPAGVNVKPPYDKPNPNIRALAFGTPMFGGMVVRADSPYKTIADLKGTRVAFGFQAFPANVMITLSNLALAGLTINDVKTVDVPETTAGQQALIENRVDSATAALGMSKVAEADAQIGVRFLQSPRDPDKLAAAQQFMPGGDVYLVPAANKEPGIKEDTYIWGYGMMIMASTHMSDETAYTLVKAWWDNLATLQPMHSQFRDWTEKTFVTDKPTVPYHPGAIKFYKEKGVWTPKMDQYQEALLKGELPFLK